MTVRSLQGTSVRREDGRVVLRHSAGRVRRDEDVQAEAALDEPRSHLGDEGHRYRDRRKCRPRGQRFSKAVNAQERVLGRHAVVDDHISHIREALSA